MVTFREVSAAVRKMVAAVSGRREKLADAKNRPGRKFLPNPVVKASPTVGGGGEGATRGSYEEENLRNDIFSGTSAGPLRRLLSLAGRSRVAPLHARRLS